MAYTAPIPEKPADQKASVDMIFQVCVVVYDLDKTVDNLKKLFNFDESSIKMRNTENYYKYDGWDGLNYNEERCEFFHKFCRLDLGYIDFEIIEPYDKQPGNPYSDFLAKNGQGLHHLGVKIGNMPALMTTMKEMGIPRMNYAEMGPVLADGTRKGCTFYDLRDYIGCILECGSVVVGPLASDPRSGNPADFDDTKTGVDLVQNK